MLVRDLLLSLIAPLLVVPASSVVAAWARRARIALEAETHAALAFALVLGWLQLGGMALGFTGTLRASTAAGWVALGVIGALGATRRLELPALRPWHACFLLPLAGYLILASVPPWQRDELVYHLALPRELARAGGYTRPDDNIFASLPLGWESAVSLLYATGRGGEPLFNPHLLTAWTSVAAAFATMGLARALGARPSWVVGSAGLGLLAIPTFVEVGTSSYVEPYLLLLVTLGLVAVAGAVARDLRAGGAAGDPETRGWLSLGAVLAGMGASVKYPGLAAMTFMGLAIMADRPGVRQRSGGFFKAPETVRRGGRFLATAAVVASPFYLRNALQRGNPFFPLAFDLFGGRGWDAVRAQAYWETLRVYGRGGSPAEDLALPLRLVLTRDLEHGFEGSLGPLVGLGVAAALLLLWRRSALSLARRRASMATASFALAYCLFWALSVRQVRFFLPAVPSLLALAAAAISLAPARAVKGWAAASMALSLCWGAGLYATLWRRQHTSEQLAGTLDRDGLLTRLLPESYPVLRELDEHVPPSGKVWLVWTRGYTYYLDRAYRLDSVFEGWRFEGLLERAEDPASFAAALRSEGFTHVLLNQRLFLEGTSADTEPGRTARLRARFDAVLKSGALVEEKAWSAMTLLRVAPAAE